MLFSEIQGYSKLKKQLLTMINSNRVSHANLFENEDGGAGLAFALAVIQYISCTNKGINDPCGNCNSCKKIQKLIFPDLHFVFPVNSSSKSGEDKKTISDDFANQWRELCLNNIYFTENQFNKAIGNENKLTIISAKEAMRIIEKLNLSSFEGDNKFMVIWLPEKMNQEAANSILKMMEEPYPKTYIFLVSKSPQRIIKTIHSRCARISIPPIPLTRDSSEYLPLAISLLSNSINGRLVDNISISEELASLGREKQKEFILLLMELIEELMRTKKNIPLQSHNIIPENSINIQAIPDIFFEDVFIALEESKTHLEANVNSKMIFFDLVSKLSL